MNFDLARYSKPARSFGRWLLDQETRTGPIGALAATAKADRRFPRDGDVATVSAYLNEQGADGDMHIALEDAELDYLSL